MTDNNDQPPKKKMRTIQGKLNFFPIKSLSPTAIDIGNECLNTSVINVHHLTSPRSVSSCSEDQSNDNDKPMKTIEATDSTKSKLKDAVTSKTVTTLPETPFHLPTDFKFPKNKRTRIVNDKKTGNSIEVTESRSCQHKWFEKWPFLHYEVQSDSLICHTCALATYNKNLLPIPSSNQTFVNVGYRKFHDVSKGIKKHIDSKLHRDAELKLAGINQKPLEMLFKSITNEQQIKARKYLGILFSSVKFLSQQGFPLRGNREDDGPLYNLMKERIYHDSPELIDIFEKRDNWMSHDIQNEIIQSFAHTIQRSMNSDISKSEWVGVVADGTTDVSGNEQFSICVQYVDNETLAPENVFMGLYNSPDSKGKTLASLIKDVFIRNGIEFNTKLSGFSFDGASNMSGVKIGAQAAIKEDIPDALYVHCSNHALDLGLQEIARNNCEIANALQFVQDVSRLIRSSSKRRDLFLNFEDDCETQMLLSICPTRWCVRARAIDRVLTNYKTVIGCLKELTDDLSIRGEARAKAKGLFKQSQLRETYFYIFAAYKIFHECEIVAKQLQSKDITANDCLELIENLKLTLQRFRTDDFFRSLIKKTDEATDNYELMQCDVRRKATPGRIRFDGKTTLDEQLSVDQNVRANIFSVLDSISADICRRFEQKDLQMAAAREKLLLNNDLSDSEDNVFNDLFAQANLPISFDKSKLQRHILQLKDLAAAKNITITTTRDVGNLLMCMGSLSRKLYSEVERLLILILSQPISVAQAERSFSCLRRLKNWLRSTMSQARLTHLAIIAMHKTRLEKIKMCDLINTFIEKNAERRSVFGVFFE